MPEKRLIQRSIRQTRPAFTLVELLVVIAIIGILVDGLVLLKEAPRCSSPEGEKSLPVV